MLLLYNAFKRANLLAFYISYTYCLYSLDGNARTSV